MKKKLILLLAFVSVASLCIACGKKDDADEVSVSEQSVSEETYYSSDTTSIGMETVEVTTSKEIKDALDIDIDVASLKDTDSMLILSNKIFEAKFLLEDVNGEDGQIIFRASKIITDSNELHGYVISDLQAFEPISNIIEGTVINSFYSSSRNMQIFTWTLNGTTYSLCFDGSYSQMTISAYFDKIAAMF